MTPADLDRLAAGRLGAMTWRRRWACLAVAVSASVASGALAGLAVRPGPVALVAAAPAGVRVNGAFAARPPSGFGRLSAVAGTEGAPPIEVAIPALGVRSRLVGLRLAASGALQPPTDYGVAGWYSDGSAPGDRGAPAVLAGHVDSRTGPGVFFRLAGIRPGDAVFIRRADGATLRFVVYRSAEYPKARFPSREVYGAQGTPELRLVTCTGTFDRRTGHYDSNRVVFARLAGQPAGRDPGRDPGRGGRP